MNKKIVGSRSRGLSNLQSAGENLQKTVQENTKEYSTENNIPLSFLIEKSLVLFVKDLVLQRIKDSVDNYHYNESVAVREAIDLLRKAVPVASRPAEIMNPTKRGRKTTASPDAVKVATSFLISEADREYIYNFIYDKQKSGGRFTKEEFFIELVNQLEIKYNIKYLK